MSSGAGSDRRGFLARLSGWVMGGVALLHLPGCDDAAGSSNHEAVDLGMHGPVQQSTKALQQPLAASAMALFAPYDDGSPFLNRWAVGHVIRGKDDQVRVVLVDTETGGHAELDLYARDPSMDPIAHSSRYGVYLDNDGRGDVKTPGHLEKLARRLAEIVGKTEAVVVLDWQVPTMRAAVTLREARELELEAQRGLMQAPQQSLLTP